MNLELFSYWRSTASWRVRLALGLKDLDYTIRPVNLLQNEQAGGAYRAISPEALVPSLRHDDFELTQSLAICEYLEAVWPQPALLPAEPQAAARVRSLCDLIACDTHPLNNLRVLAYLTGPMGLDEDAKLRWYRHWIAQSFAALETRLADEPGDYAFGDAPGLAECFLIPQLYNARRFDCPLDDYPRLVEIDARCAPLPAFVAAHPDQQPDRPA